MTGKKETVYVHKPEALGAIVSWMWNKSVWYGPLFGEWWEKEGANIFTKYAKKHKTKYQKEPDMKMLKELYQACSRGNT